MKRRTFFKFSIAAIGAVLLSLTALDFNRVVQRILTSDTEKLSFSDPDIVTRFLEDAERERFWNQFSLAKRVFISVHHLFNSIGIRLPYYSKYLQNRSVITGHFLLSTDLFPNTSQTKRPLNYRGFFNPYREPCANPFSNLRVQDDRSIVSA